MKSTFLNRALPVALFSLSFAGFSSARAATIEHKWRAGEQLLYDVALDGTMSVETDPGAPMMFAGVPLDIKLTGGADINLDTREATPDGGATVAFTFPRIKVNGSAWEQNLALSAAEGNLALTFNGRKTGKDTPLPWLLDPDYALQVSRNAKIERIIALKEKPVEAMPEDDAKTEEPKGGLPVNVAGLIRSMALQMLPTLWPGREVAAGETWSVESRLPVPSQKEGTPLELLPFGKFDLTLGDEEEIGGKRAYRVALKGTFDIDKAKAARLNPAGKGSRLENASQKIDGDLWFDAAAGQLVRADLKLSGGLAGFIAQPAKSPADTPTAYAASQRFNGTLKLNLKSATMKAQ